MKKINYMGGLSRAALMIRAWRNSLSGKEFLFVQPGINPALSEGLLV